MLCNRWLADYNNFKHNDWNPNKAEWAHHTSRYHRQTQRISLHSQQLTEKEHPLPSRTQQAIRNRMYFCPKWDDRKLPKMSLKRKDLAKILEIILSKEEMTLPDRNMLRRILVEIFD